MINILYYNKGDIDVSDECWGLNVLVTNLRCW